MANPSYAAFKGVTNIRQDLLTQNLLHSLIEFYNWGFVNVGGFQNITRTPPVSGVDGGNRFRLRPVRDPRFTNGRVWEGFRCDWVYETGISYDVQPIRPSGVWVNNSFSLFSGTSYVDYRNGRVILENAISQNSIVETEFSPRYVRFDIAEKPWPVKLMTEAERIERGDFLQAASGSWNPLGDTRAQLPYVAVEVVPTRGASFKPYQIGGGQYTYHDVCFHIFAETPEDKDQIKDVIEYQNDRAVLLIDRGRLKASADFPASLDYKGDVSDSPLFYPDLVASETGAYTWGHCWCKNTQAMTLQPINSWIYRSIVRTTCEIIKLDI